MPSVKNPNKPSKNRIAARNGRSKKAAMKSAARGVTKITKNESMRGARTGLMPTSGAGAPLSSKKQRKVDKALAHALKRKMEASGEVEMKDISEPKTAAKKANAEQVVEMDIE